MSGLEPMQVELKDANAFVASLHRHHKPTTGHRFSLGVQKDGALVGVAICGRPVARTTPAREVLEVTRVCTDGTKNACSFLYGAAARIAKDLGYRRVQTFLLDTEPAHSVKAAGFVLDGETRPPNWNRPGRKPQPEHLTGPKQRWVKELR